MRISKEWLEALNNDALDTEWTTLFTYLQVRISKEWLEALNMMP